MSDKYLIYTGEYCSYCSSAKRLLESHQLAYEEVDLTANHELRLELSKQHNWRTIPMIFLGGRFIGGFQELKKYLNSAKK